MASVILQEANWKHIHTHLYCVKGTNWEVGFPKPRSSRIKTSVFVLISTFWVPLDFSVLGHTTSAHSTTASSCTILTQRPHLFPHHPWRSFQRNQRKLSCSSRAESQAWSVAGGGGAGKGGVLPFCLYFLVFVFSEATWLTDTSGFWSGLRLSPQNENAVPDKGRGSLAGRKLLRWSRAHCMT